MRVVIFRRNFGQTAAMAAGFDFAAGDVFVTMDGDLQNDAEDIPKLVDQLVYGNQGGHPVNTGVVREDGGYDLVCGWRRKRKDNAFTRNFPSWVANMLIGALTGVRDQSPIKEFELRNRVSNGSVSARPIRHQIPAMNSHHDDTINSSWMHAGEASRLRMQPQSLPCSSPVNSPPLR